MATEAQSNANRGNAKHSTGPVTDSGKANSSRNALTLGLYTRCDYVKPEERDIYKEFCETMYDQLTPANLLEESFVAEITGATWRLRRCNAAEGELGDFDEATDKTRRSIERARASAHSALQRSLNQLRKLQTERITREQLGLGNTDDAPLAEARKVCEALNIHNRNQKNFAKAGGDAIDQQLASIMNDRLDPELERELFEKYAGKGHAAEAALASNCETADPIVETEDASPDEIGEFDVETPIEAPPDLDLAA